MDPDPNASNESAALKEVLDKVHQYSEEGFSIFNCSMPISSYKNIAPILWEGTWESFMDFTAKSRTNVIYLFVGRDKNDPVAIEIGCFIESRYHMVRVGDLKSLELITNRIIDNIRSPNASTSIKKLEAQPLEELEKEVIGYIDGHYAETIYEKYEIKSAVRGFLNEKGIGDVESTPSLMLKTGKLVSSIQKTMQKRKVEEENSRIPNLVMRCVEWARSCGIKRLYRSEISLFLRELSINDLTDEGEELLELQVNNALSSSV